MLKGVHCIGGEWEAGGAPFWNDPVRGEPDRFSAGTAVLVDAAARRAELAFEGYARLPRSGRAAFLRRIAAEIEGRADEILAMAARETGLPEGRLAGERRRTEDQLRLFAAHIEKGDYLDRRRDGALPLRLPLPRAEHRLIQRPIGPVAVFGSSNFPLAFSVAGGDTASALAAGCPVVVKGHSSHPGVSDLVAQAVCEAAAACAIDPGVFSLIQGGDRSVGAALVRHPAIKAVGFTGSLRGGRALFDLCASREEPIPFYGELGSINPVFALPGALRKRGAEMAEAWAKSLTMGAGQFCTNPGLVVALEGEDARSFAAAARAFLEGVGPQTMLNRGISEAYHAGCSRFSSDARLTKELEIGCGGRAAAPQLYSVGASAWLADDSLAEEVFGPLGLIVLAGSEAELLEVARRLQGQLTCSMHLDGEDMDLAKKLVPILERKAGRLLVNAFPTGVEVCDSMVHGGPYPASTNFGATSVGTMAMRRFLRPVCYQNFPEELLPEDAQSMPAP